MLNTAILGMLALALSAVAGQPSGQPPSKPAAPPKVALRDDAASEHLGWHLGVQAWTFRDRTAFEAIDTAARLGVRFIELFPGQLLGGDDPKAEVGPALSEAQRQALRDRLSSAGVHAMSYGVVGVRNDEAAARKHFEFVKSMGMPTLVAEPAVDARDLVSRLADEYQVRVAIHNHPKPSLYWNPDTLLEALAGRSALLGACADTGHWPRSGLRALDCLKKLEGHVIELHFKDIAKGNDRPWGTGESDALGMLTELKRQGFKGQVYIEYEIGQGAELEANVARCIEFFDSTARSLEAAR